jgi:diadenosine tetraphosphate (Ap4A) HIT family hydrolase
LIVPRGGGSNDSDGNGNPPAQQPTFPQQLQHYETSMTAFLNHYQTATEHMLAVLTRTMELDQKTDKALKDLQFGLFRVQLQLSMLPPELCGNFQTLHAEMLALQAAANTMLTQLGIYTEVVTKCLEMVQGLIQKVQEKANELPQLEKEERKLRSSMRGNKKKKKQYDKLQFKVQADVAMDKHAREDIWPIFMDSIQKVQEAAKNVDRIFKSVINVRNGNGNSGSSTVPFVTPDASSSSSYNYGLEADVQEVEVEMTTYQFNMY